jgi:hypothetical protein
MNFKKKWGWLMSEANLAFSIERQETELNKVGLPIKKIMLLPAAENNNRNSLAALCMSHEQLFNDIYRYTDKLIDNFWQNINFLDEITVNYINNLAQTFTNPPENISTNYLSDIAELQKKLISINEQTIFDMVDYIAVPAYKQSLSYISNTYSILNKQLHYTERLTQSIG